MDFSQVSTALRGGVIVFGITALAVMVQKLVGQSDIALFLITNQLRIPGAVWLSEFIGTFTIGLATLLIAFLVSKSYWRTLFPGVFDWQKMLVCLVVGLVFALFVNHAVHQILFDFFYGRPVLVGGALSEALFNQAGSDIVKGSRLVTMAGFATVLVSPFVEELTDRGILFKECESLKPWQIAVVSVLVFSLAHFATGGMVKVLAIFPVALLFVGLRLWSGSFAYTFPAHVAVNAVALAGMSVT
jgi:membrane protease YdiL (CAAX protease family)